MIERIVTDEENLASIFFKISMVQNQECERLLKPFHITSEQMLMLIVLSKHDSINQKNLSKYIAKDQPNTARILKRLLDKGLATRATAETDKRMNLIHLTEKGHALIDEIVPKMLATRNDFQSRFPIELHDELIRLAKLYLEKTVEFAGYYKWK